MQENTSLNIAIIRTKAVAVMSSTQNLPPVDSSTVGPKAKALTALINQAATKASEGDRTAQALTLGNFPGNPVRLSALSIE